MIEILINDIEQAMLNTLNNEQLSQLRKVLEYTFRNVSVTENEQTNTKESNTELVASFISSKSVEGCSENTIAYYRSTINNALTKIDKKISHITTDDLRNYMNNYQKESGASKVTVDNIRRILSSFFAWLEDENYIVKSPPDFVIASPKNLHQRVWRFSDALPSTLSECIPPCSEVA